MYDQNTLGVVRNDVRCRMTGALAIAAPISYFSAP